MRSLRALEALLRLLREQGRLDAEQQQAVQKGMRKLRLGTRKGNRKMVEAAIDDIARAFLRRPRF